MKNKLILTSFVLFLALPAFAQDEPQSQRSTPKSPHESYQRGRMGQGMQEEKDVALNTIQRATDVYRQITSDSRTAKRAEELSSNAQCIAVFPNVTRAALAIGGQGGKGVAACKNNEGQWSQVSFMGLAGASIGAQIGATTSDVVMYFINNKGREALRQGKTTLGGDLGVVAGQFDQSIDYKTSGASIVALSNQSGFFASAALGGTRLYSANDLNTQYYGQTMNHDQLLSSFNATNQPRESRAFTDALSGKVS